MNKKKTPFYQGIDDYQETLINKFDNGKISLKNLRKYADKMEQWITQQKLKDGGGIYLNR